MKDKKFNVTNKNHLLSVLLVGLLVVLGYIPFVFWESYAPSILIWCYATVIDTLILFLLFIFHVGTKQDNEKTKQLEELHKKLESEKIANKVYKARADETDQILERNYNLETLNTNLKQKLKDREDSINEYEKLYSSVLNDNTRLYATESFKYSNRLSLFDPLRYRENSRYAMIIDQNAKELYNILKKPTDGLFKDNTYYVTRKLGELLQRDASSNKGYSPVLTRDYRTQLLKIDKEEER